MTTETLLVELFTEELPPKALQKLGEAFATEIFRGLESNDFLESGASKKVFASPRRIAVQISHVRAESPPKQVKTKLMPASVALDKDGKATPALKKKLNTLGYQDDADFDAMLRESITREQDGKNEVLILNDIAVGVALATRLSGAIDLAIAKLPIPKVMSYQLADGMSTVQFVRPVHRLLAMRGSEIVQVGALGLVASNVTEGHRFQGEKLMMLATASDYEVQLEGKGGVIPSFEKRRAEIDRQLRAQASVQNAALESGDAYQALLDEVTALVEMPTVYVGQFEPVFLEVPQECLILTMRANQKYFPLLDSVGKLTNKFLIVSNMRLADATNIVSGNERVIRPRLADARFFFDQDRKRSLESRVDGLAKVVYHSKLGSMGERVARVRSIAQAIGGKIGGPRVGELAERAAQLAKADLQTDMVGEFPELQGIMGRYYAQNDKESGEVADAIEDHYKPRFSGDTLPRTEVGIAVALADKLEVLVGLFSAGEKPSGDKDPFALRRHALGIVRLLIEPELKLDLNELLIIAAQQLQLHANWRKSDKYSDNDDFARMYSSQVSVESADLPGLDAAENFIFDRLAGMLREEGYNPQEIDAILSLRPQRLAEVPKRLSAVRAFMQLPEAESLAAANKRVANILKKSEESSVTSANVDESKLVESAERGLFTALRSAAPSANRMFQTQDFTGYLKSFAVLKAPIDSFFDNVMVNADDPALRDNRLALLHDLRSAMNKVADISKLAS